MIVNTSYKKEVFLRAINKHFGELPFKYSELDGIYYFSAGYYRGIPRTNKKGDFAIQLINPSLDAAGLIVIEQAICIIEGLEYQRTLTEVAHSSHQE